METLSCMAEMSYNAGNLVNAKTVFQRVKLCCGIITIYRFGKLFHKIFYSESLSTDKVLSSLFSLVNTLQYMWSVNVVLCFSLGPLFRSICSPRNGHLCFTHGTRWKQQRHRKVGQHRK